jgi:hypothetical protein
VVVVKLGVAGAIGRGALREGAGLWHVEYVVSLPPT